MPRILKRPAAESDLVAQWVWYAENGGDLIRVIHGNRDWEHILID